MKFSEIDLTVGPSVRSVWIAWAAAVIFSVLVYWPTLTLTKHIWQDEVQILELGRALWPDADLSHGMFWDLEAKRPTRPLNYLGMAIQELCYRIFAPGVRGARVSSLIGAACASAALLGWLLSRGGGRWVALACSLLMFWDPLFVEGYRGARIDSWTMALMLLSLWIVAEGRRRPLGRSGFAPWEIVAGACIALAGLYWVSAILLIPLVMYEVLRSDVEQTTAPWGIRLASLVWLGFFSVAAMVILLLPVAPMIGEMMAGTFGAAGERASGGIQLGAFAAPYVRSPWIPLVALAALVYGRQWALALAFVAAVVGVLLTGAYVHRSNYLLPYMLLAVAVGANKLVEAPVGGLPKRPVVVAVGLLLMLTWSAGLSLGARTAVALKEQQLRDPDSLELMLRENLPTGSLKAYIVPYELYYAARSLGWKYYKTGRPEDWSQEKLQDLLSQMDVVIQRRDDTQGPPEELMNSLGFFPRKVSTGSGPAKKWENYGEYIIYER
jgi:hypothetical protein